MFHETSLCDSSIVYSFPMTYKVTYSFDEFKFLDWMLKIKGEYKI